jgi:hypothetical protein
MRRTKRAVRSPGIIDRIPPTDKSFDRNLFFYFFILFGYDYLTRHRLCFRSVFGKMALESFLQKVSTNYILIIYCDALNCLFFFRPVARTLFEHIR